MKSVTALSLLALLAVAHAPAALADCVPLANLDNPKDSCKDNGKYLQAGIACFEKLDRDVKRKTGALGEGMRKNREKSGSGQSGEQAGSAAGYQIADTALVELIAGAIATKASLTGYIKNIYYPEDFDAPPAEIGNASTFIRSSPCYAEPHKQLKKMIKQTDAYIAQLEAAKRATETMRNMSTGRKGLLDTKAGSKVKSTKGVGAGAKGLEQEQVPSTITGTEEDERKRKAK